jgi:hypothetical protein
MTYKGKVVRGLPHGTGAISFSNNPNRKIQTTFHTGVVQDHSRGTLTLGNSQIVQIDSFRESWDPLLQHSAHAELSRMSAAGSRVNYVWDGQHLSAVVDGTTRATVSVQNATEGTSEEQEIFELLNALKWFEYHFAKTQMMLESEVYPFETHEQQQKELERKKEEQKKEMTNDFERKLDEELRKELQGKQEL